MALPLEGKVALVTGAARRIGRGIALRLASEGADVAITYRSSKQDADSLVREITGLGRNAVALRADVTSVADLQAAIESAAAFRGRLDILVNNAGMFSPATVAALTEAQWDTMLATNVKSQFFAAQAAAPHLRRAGNGKIINLASLGGLLAWPNFPHYCVSKAGVIMLTRCLARALAPEITVNAIAPGTISFPGDAPEISEDFVRRAPLKRTGESEDIAGAVSYLAQANFVTGQLLVVDGGRSLT
jgi:3-oxoacyl-[acyl-carrier protein] reductase/pteridine reductase